MKLTGIKNAQPFMTLDEIFEVGNDPHGLLKNVKIKSKERANDSHLSRKFEEINQFIDIHDRVPSIDSSEITEALLAESLKAICDKSFDDSALKSMDRHQLLPMGKECITEPNSLGNQAKVAGSTIAAASKVTSLDDIFNMAGDLLDDSADIFNLKHVPAQKKSKDMPDEIADRFECLDFWKFEALFNSMHDNLKNGKFQLQKFSNNSQIREGDFFILNGVTCFVASMEGLSERTDRNNPRMRLIFENGLESNMLMRSLAASLYKDENGRRVMQGADAVTDALINVTHKDKPLGYLYVLRSLGNKPELARFEDLYKIGFTTTTIEERIKNATRDTAFLEAPVEIVTFFECREVNPHMLERLVHTFLEAQRLTLMLIGRDGKPYLPNEWFNVPLETIRNVVARISDGTINQYRMDNTTGEMVRK